MAPAQDREFYGCVYQENCISWHLNDESQEIILLIVAAVGAGTSAYCGPAGRPALGPHAEVKEVDFQGHSLASPLNIEAKLTLDPLPQRHSLTSVRQRSSDSRPLLYYGPRMTLPLAPQTKRILWALYRSVMGLSFINEAHLNRSVLGAQRHFVPA